jgi:hypothetical protein
MLQFYFLSILLNLVTGLVLVYATDFTKKQPVNDSAAGEKAGDVKEEVQKKQPVKNMKLSFTGNTAFFDDHGFRLILGLLTCFTGIMKLLSVVRNDIPIIGDLIPALAGLAGGFTLLVEYYMVTTTTDVKLSENMQKIFIDGRKYVGVFCIIAGLLHFLFPSVLFL